MRRRKSELRPTQPDDEVREVSFSDLADEEQDFDEREIDEAARDRDERTVPEPQVAPPRRTPQIQRRRRGEDAIDESNAPLLEETDVADPADRY